MPKFPNREADIEALAKAMIFGCWNHGGDFPSVDVITLGTRLNSYSSARAAQSQAHSAVRLATERKNAALDGLIGIMKGCLHKSEVDSADNPARLAYIGWGPKASAQPVAAPDQVPNLTSAKQGAGRLKLMWQGPQPGCGGPVRTYIIERRSRQAGGDFSPWRDVAASVGTEIELTGQPRLVQLEYRVKAVNLGGEGIASNTAPVVL